MRGKRKNCNSKKQRSSFLMNQRFNNSKSKFKKTKETIKTVKFKNEPSSLNNDCGIDVFTKLLGPKNKIIKQDVVRLEEIENDEIDDILIEKVEIKKMDKKSIETEQDNLNNKMKNVSEGENNVIVISDEEADKASIASSNIEIVDVKLPTKCRNNFNKKTRNQQSRSSNFPKYFNQNRWLESFADKNQLIKDKNEKMVKTPQTDDTSSCEQSEQSIDKPPKVKDGFSNYCKILKMNARFWQKCLRNSDFNRESFDFTVCSYNVLCQKTISTTQYLYGHLKKNKSYLEWENRWNGLKEELPSLNADIIGLQEVQADHYKKFFVPLFRKNAMLGKFKKKKGLNIKPDGCAIFYKPEKFEELMYKEVEYFISEGTCLDRENVGQIIVLKCKKTANILIFANTHLLFNMDRGDVKLAQIVVLFANIHQIRSFFPNSSMIICGDFNIEPNSFIYKFITTGQLFLNGSYIGTLSREKTKKLSTKRTIEAENFLPKSVQIGLDSQFYETSLKPNDGKVRHPFTLTSVYKYNETQKKKTVSTYHKDKGNPDFIFYNVASENNEHSIESENLKLLHRLSLPFEQHLLNAEPWPNQHVPSDHIPLLARFRFIKND